MNPSKQRDRALRGKALRARLESVPRGDRDSWIDNLLEIDHGAEDFDLPRGAVPYLPCAVAEILALIDMVPVTANDFFVDIGSGIGRVPFLVHLLTGARAHGIEIQRPLAARAREFAQALGLEKDVTFVGANAADIELEGTVFFMYAPCNGELLARVLSRMEDVSKRHPITVCTVDLVLDYVPWLSLRATTASKALAIYKSR